MSTGLFTWIPFYEAFADKLLEYKDRQHELFDIIKEMSDEERFLRHFSFQREEYWEERDNKMNPISVMASLNRDITDNNRIRLARKYAEKFSINAPVPQDFAGIPTINNMRSLFDNRLWGIFIEAMQAADSRTFSPAFPEVFDSVSVSRKLFLFSTSLVSTTMVHFLKIFPFKKLIDAYLKLQS